MNFGAIQGLVNGTEQVVFDSEVTGSAVSSISTGNILNGDEDGWYTIIFRLVATGTALCLLRFNADAGTNYGRRGISATNTTVADASATGENQVYFGYATTGLSGFSVMRMYVKSGAVRLMNWTRLSSISGTTVGDMQNYTQVWSNTADNITNLAITTSGSNMDVGTRLIIFKSNNFTNGTPTGTITTPKITGAWTRVGSQVLGSASASVTFSGLNGDTAVAYYLSAQVKNSYAGANTYYVRPNAISSGYGSQNLYATDTTVGGDRDASTASLGTRLYTANQNEICTWNTLLFAKTGFLRPSITQLARSISGTTIGLISVEGSSLNDTSTNITSLAITSTANYMDVGSQFDLYALYT